MHIGTDITFISRFVDNQKLAERILSPREFLLYQEAPVKENFLAGRFAAKEAFIKACRGQKNLKYANIEILYDEYGAPYILYDDNVFSLSISHDGEYAVAVVVI